MIGIIIITVVALVLSVIIVLLDNFVNEEEHIVKLLPGYNCGACGYKSCMGLANELLINKEEYKKCRFLNGDGLSEIIKFLYKE